MPPPPLSQKSSEALKAAIERESLKAASGFDGICYRNAKLKYADPTQILSTEWSEKKGGRYNPPGIAMLYLSCDEHTCLEEAAYVLRQIRVNPAKVFPRAVFAIRVKLSKILDLTKANVRRALGITKLDLRAAHWLTIQNAGGEAVTQSIGRYAKEAGFEALLVPSARYRGNNLNLFYPANILPPSIVEVIKESD